MFESTREVLSLFGKFMLIGFALGFFYNIGRFVRLILPKLKALSAVIDFFSVAISALIVFIFSVSLGVGFFRLYYAAAALLGFGIYMFTLGAVTPPAAKAAKKLINFTADLVKKVFTILIVEPFLRVNRMIKQNFLIIFRKIYKIVSNFAQKCKIHLKSRAEMLYNNKVSEISGSSVKKAKGGEARHVIKAKVRKNP